VETFRVFPRRFVDTARVGPEPREASHRTAGMLTVLGVLPPTMSEAEHVCPCGATLRYKQDIVKEQGDVYATWKCRDCGTQVPGTVAEKLRHQHPS